MILFRFDTANDGVLGLSAPQDLDTWNWIALDKSQPRSTDCKFLPLGSLDCCATMCGVVLIRAYLLQSEFHMQILYEVIMKQLNSLLRDRPIYRDTVQEAI